MEGAASALTMLLAAALFSRRFDLGLGNPNTTAALLVMVLISLWAFFPAGWWSRILVAFISIPISILLALTSSRGALVALAAGAAVLAAAWIGRRRPIAEFVCLAAMAAFCAVVFAAMPSSGKRLQGMSQDESLAARWTIYSRIPEMILAAPSGWGAARSAEAYHHWFQPAGDFTRFQHVLSTHAVWLVERGWPVRLLYLSGWMFAILWAWPGKDGRLWWLGGCGCIVAFGVAGLFSHVGERAVMWLPAGAWLFAIAADRVRLKVFPSRKEFGVAASAVLGCLALVFGLGWAWRETPAVSLANGVATIATPGEMPSHTIGVIAEQAVVGEWFGQQVRAGLPTKTQVRFLWEPDGVPGSVDVLFLAGRSARLPKDNPGLKVWINPPVGVPGDLAARGLDAAWIYWGQLRSGSAYQWKAAFGDKPDHLKYLPGTDEYVPEAWKKFLAAMNASGFPAR